MNTDQKLRKILKSIEQFVGENGYETFWECALEEIGFVFGDCGIEPKEDSSTLSIDEMGNRPDGYPANKEFWKAAKRVLDERFNDEIKAEEFLKEMDKHFRNIRNK